MSMRQVTSVVFLSKSNKSETRFFVEMRSRVETEARTLSMALTLLPSLVCSLTPGGGVPPIAVLAAQQQAISFLASGWPTISGRMLGDAFSGASVQAALSQIHGTGLFATQDIEAGELVAFHPLDRILQTLGNGQVAGALMDDEVDSPYFRAGATSDELAARQTAYRKLYRHVDPRRPESFMLDANPLKPDITGWLGHRINDGACLAADETSEEAILNYYSASGERRNVCTVALCCPLVGFVTTRAVPTGEELLATFGHQYWTGASTYAAGEQATRLSEVAALVNREADLWQVATDKRYHKECTALSTLIARTSTALMEVDEESRSSTRKRGK